jgi:hypothetical protein
LAPALTPPAPATVSFLLTWLTQQLPALPRAILAVLTALDTGVQNSLRYNRREELDIQSTATALVVGSGSCRDYAVVFSSKPDKRPHTLTSKSKPVKRIVVHPDLKMLDIVQFLEFGKFSSIRKRSHITEFFLY